MKYCKKCLQPDTRPGILFDENQVCFACKYTLNHGRIDWLKREEELRAITNEAKMRSRGGWRTVRLRDRR